MSGVTLRRSDAFAHTTHWHLTQRLRLPFRRGATSGLAAQSDTRHRRSPKWRVYTSRLRPPGGGSTPPLKPSASVLLFNRTEQQAREQQVLARISPREALPIAAEREIELELWRATQIAAGAAKNVRASRCVLDNADAPYNISMARFTSSVGSILEMLSAQNALASANSSATQAQITALAARIRLSLASGRMQLAK